VLNVVPPEVDPERPGKSIRIMGLVAGAETQKRPVQISTEVQVVMSQEWNDLQE
jgi:hypothetical protein